jgi:CubicO group peptidase (beta-lactamase class C family)
LIAALLVGACSVAEKETSSAGAPEAPDENGPAGVKADGGATQTPNKQLPAGAVPTCTTDLKEALTRLAVPGLSAGIVKNGKLVCTAVSGLANIEENRPVTPDTVFDWASVSKTVTAVTLMTLFDEGKLGLDDAINAHLPFQVAVPSCPTTPITFRHLLTHTSSITEDDEDGAYADSYVQGDSPIPLGDFLKGYLVPGGSGYNAKENFEKGCPGTISSYSNVGAGLLGYLAEQIGKTPFDQLAQERVFKPLGMNESSFRVKGFDLTHLAMPYEISGTTFTAAGHFGFPTYPDGMLHTSIPQMARFLLMFMQLGEYEGTSILARTTAEEMRRFQIPALDDTQALIWYSEAFGGRPLVIGHNGGDPGVSSNMYFDPDDGSGVLLVANGEWNEPESDALMTKLFLEAKSY